MTSDGITTATDIRERLSELSDAVDACHRRLDEFQDSLATRVRTRDVVVVDDDGFERIRLRAAPGFGAITVYARDGSPEPTCAELVANDGLGSEPASVSVALTRAGDVVATLELVEGYGPALFLAEADPDHRADHPSGRETDP